MYTVILSDGTRIENLDMNGNNFVSASQLTASDFSGKLSRVTIDGPYGQEDHGPMELIQIQKHGNEWWFILLDVSTQEIRNAEIAAMLDGLDAQSTYTAMMTDTLMEG